MVSIVVRGVHLMLHFCHPGHLPFMFPFSGLKQIDSCGQALPVEYTDEEIFGDIPPPLITVRELSNQAGHKRAQKRGRKRICAVDEGKTTENSRV